jgi:membrane protease YdiL (CAAX protease family)
MGIKKINPHIADLAGLAVLIGFMILLMYCDPFWIGYKIIDFLRLKYAVFTKEPRLLFYSYTYIGTLLAKIAALIAIGFLLLIRRLKPDENLGTKMPDSDRWKRLVLPFVILSALLRVSYSADPMIPNLPMQFIFPEAMILGNILIISSALIIAPITEELIFRGYMQDVIKRSFGAFAAVLVTSFLFSLAHSPRMGLNFEALSIIFFLGLLFGYLRNSMGSIYIPILFHAIYNTVYMIVSTANYIRLGY